ncbi:MAG: ABC transporter permease [Actinomycetota bacterium]
MTAAPAPALDSERPRPRYDHRILAHSAALVWRNVIRIKREPSILAFTLIQPIIFVLLFSFVYSGVISIPGVNYTDFIMAGIFAQTIVFGATITASSLAQDLQSGFIARLRTLPINSAAVLIGRTGADLGVTLLSITVMILTGLAVGWRIRSDLVGALAGVGLLVLFAFAMSWLMVFLGLSVRNPEAITSASLLLLFPLTFVSEAFVPASTLPQPLHIIAEWNPVSALVYATRNLFGNLPAATAPETWLQSNAIGIITVSSLALLCVFIPLSVRRFARLNDRL